MKAKHYPWKGFHYYVIPTCSHPQIFRPSYGPVQYAYLAFLYYLPCRTEFKHVLRNMLFFLNFCDAKSKHRVTDVKLFKANLLWKNLEFWDVVKSAEIVSKIQRAVVLLHKINKKYVTDSRSGLEKRFILVLVQFLEILFWNFLKKRYVSDYLSWTDSYVSYICAHNYAQNFHQGDCMQSSSKVVDYKFSL